MSTSRRIVGSLMQRAMGIAVGFDPIFLQELVVVHGVGPVVKWMRVTTRIIEGTEQHFGPVHAQMLTGLAAIWGGCHFCSRGHVYASNVLRFQQDGTLFPLRRDVVLDLQTLPDDEIWDRITPLLATDPRLLELATLQREMRQRVQLAPTTEDERQLAATLAAWDWIMDCTVLADPLEDVPPLHPAVSKDLALQARYAAALAAESADR